jgi:hypothetical protein
VDSVGEWQTAAGAGAPPSSGEDLVYAALNRGGGVDPRKVDRGGICSKCGTGNYVSLEDAKEKMDPMGNYEWGADGVWLYCHPKAILPGSVERDKFRVAFIKCACHLWTSKFGENPRCWKSFRKENQCKNDFQARVRHKTQQRGKTGSKRPRDTEQVVVAHDPETLRFANPPPSPPQLFPPPPELVEHDEHQALPEVLLFQHDEIQLQFQHQREEDKKDEAEGDVALGVEERVVVQRERESSQEVVVDEQFGGPIVVVNSRRTIWGNNCYSER